MRSSLHPAAPLPGIASYPESATADARRSFRSRTTLPPSTFRATTAFRKAMTMKTRTTVSALFALALVAGLGATPARASDAVLYEVSEAVKLNWHSGKFQSSEATLMGAVKAGTALCPLWLAAKFDIDRCWLTVRARGQADDQTGIGPVDGAIQILSQDKNSVDAAERIIIAGRFKGTMDLSRPFTGGVPIGYMIGEFEVEGVKDSVAAGFKAKGNFTGTFRLPFAYDNQAAYMRDNGTIVVVSSDEHSIGNPTVRLEVKLGRVTVTTPPTR